MSRMVREWLQELRLLEQTSHEDRIQIDKEIENYTGLNCDEALRQNLISKEKFREIVESVLKRKRKVEAPMVV